MTNLFSEDSFFQSFTYGFIYFTAYISFVLYLIHKIMQTELGNKYLFIRKKYHKNTLDLMDKIEKSDIESVKDLLKKGVNINYNNDQAIMIAADKQNIEIMEALIDKGADIKTNMYQILREGCMRNRIEVVRLALENGCDPKYLDCEALRLACRYGHHEIVEMLLKFKYSSLELETPIKLAEGYKHLKVHNLLMEYLDNKNKSFFNRTKLQFQRIES